MLKKSLSLVCLPGVVHLLTITQPLVATVRPLVLCVCSEVKSRVVVDGKVVTSAGPGTSLEFALSLVNQLFGKEKADEVAAPMVVSQGLQY